MTMLKLSLTTLLCSGLTIFSMTSLAQGVTIGGTVAEGEEVLAGGGNEARGDGVEAGVADVGGATAGADGNAGGANDELRELGLIAEGVGLFLDPGDGVGG